jgi:hypothetical protein
MKRDPFFIGLLLLLGCSVAAARECRNVDFPDHLQVKSTDLTLNGLGIRKATILKVNVYVAALYVTTRSQDPKVLADPNTPAELILHFVRNVGVGDIRNAWNEGFEKAAKDQLPLLSARIQMFNSWMSDVKTGQRLTFTRIPASGVQVSVNGVAKGTITGDDFSRALFSIWLGPEPPNADLKKGLLGGSCE